MTVKNLNCNRSKWKGLPQVPIHKRGLIVKNSDGRDRDRKKKKKKKKRRPDQRKVHEDECYRCGEGGELVMCDRSWCPKAYHMECLNLIKPPNGEYSVSQGLLPGVPQAHQTS